MLNNTAFGNLGDILKKQVDKMGYTKAMTGVEKIKEFEKYIHERYKIYEKYLTPISYKDGTSSDKNGTLKLYCSSGAVAQDMIMCDISSQVKMKLVFVYKKP